VIIRAVKYFKLASVADWRTRALIGPPPLQLMEATEGEEGQTDYTTVYLPACPDVISYWENLGFGHLDEEWLLDQCDIYPLTIFGDCKDMYLEFPYTRTAQHSRTPIPAAQSEGALL
jgi:hypothetical protein